MMSLLHGPQNHDFVVEVLGAKQNGITFSLSGLGSEMNSVNHYVWSLL